MIQNVFCWLPLATLIDQKVLVIHGGVSDTTDLDMLEKIQRNKVGFISWMLQEKSVLLICGWRAYTYVSAWLLTRERERMVFVVKKYVWIWSWRASISFNRVCAGDVKGESVVDLWKLRVS